MDNFLEINSNSPILHACVIDWGSDYVLKPPKEFDPLPPDGVVAPPPLVGRWRGGARSRVAACQAHRVGSIGL